MIGNFISSLNKKLRAVEFSKPRSRKTGIPERKNNVCRDELSKTQRQPQPPMKQAVKRRVRFAETEPVIISIEAAAGEEERECNCKDVEEEGGNVIRVRIVMTKREASRLLSKCKNGGVLDVEDVARQLIRNPTARVIAEPVYS